MNSSPQGTEGTWYQRGEAAVRSCRSWRTPPPLSPRGEPKTQVSIRPCPQSLDPAARLAEHRANRDRPGYRAKRRCSHGRGAHNVEPPACCRIGDFSVGRRKTSNTFQARSSRARPARDGPARRYGLRRRAPVRSCRSCGPPPPLSPRVSTVQSSSARARRATREPFWTSAAAGQLEVVAPADTAVGIALAEMVNVSIRSWPGVAWTPARRLAQRLTVRPSRIARHDPKLQLCGETPANPRRRLSRLITALTGSRTHQALLADQPKISGPVVGKAVRRL